MRERHGELFADGFVFLEGPRWHKDRLWVCDVFERELHAVTGDGRSTLILGDLPPVPNSLGFLPDGTPVLVASKERRLMRLVDGALVLHADLSGHASGDLNDFVVDPQGRITVGNFGYDIHAGAPEVPTCLHLVETDGTVRTVAEGLEFPNGSVLLDGGRLLVVAETWVGRLTAFDRDAEGNLSNRRLFADLSGRNPDGICADAEGAVWASSFNTGEVLRVLDGGTITDRLTFEGSAVACQLGGEDGRTLFCTTYSGSIPDQLARKRLGAIQAARVDVPAPARS